MLAFSILASVVTGTSSDLRRHSSVRAPTLTKSLREGERGSSLGKSPARSALIAVEIALSLVLLVGAGLMMKSFVRLTRVDPGFNPDQLLVFNIGLARSADGTQQTNFYHEVVERIKAVPGVQSVGAVSRLPLAGGIARAPSMFRAIHRAHEADVRVGTPDYLPTMGIPLVQRPSLYRTRHDSTFVAGRDHQSGDGRSVLSKDRTRSANT